MSTKIFLSYRRDDSQAETILIYEALTKHFGKAGVFMDTSTIQAGDTWPERIKTALTDAQLVLAVIIHNRDWLGVDDLGDRRIQQDDDWVRQELALALESGKRLIPILAKDGDIPTPKYLHDSIQALHRMQALKIDFGQWDREKQRLVDKCKEWLAGTGQPTVQPRTPAMLERDFGSFSLLAAQVLYPPGNESFLAGIAGNRSDLYHFVATVQRVRETKELHDIAHDVQVEALGTFKRRLMGPLPFDLMIEFLDQYECIATAIEKLQQLKQEGQFVHKETGWVDDFMLILKELEYVIRSNETDRFLDTAHKLDSLIKVQQADLNNRLVRLVEGDLYLRQVTHALVAALWDPGSPPEPERQGTVKAACSKLELFEQQFQMLLTIHDKWQEIDRYLLRLESELSHRNHDVDVQHASKLLIDVEQKLDAALTIPTQTRLPFMHTMHDNLRKLSDKLLKAGMRDRVDGKELEGPLRVFIDPAQKIFRAIDRSLREKCRELVQLEALVKEILALSDTRGDLHA
jgi:hypothetical protein